MDNSNIRNYEVNSNSTNKKNPILTVKNISKEFPGVLANDNVNFDIYGGEILAILGENGAGKSTIMKILSGLYKPDTGELHANLRWFNEKNPSPNSDSLIQIHFQSPNDAIKLGIGMVHQHFNLVEPMTVIENITLGKEFTKKYFKILPILDQKMASEYIKNLSEKYGLKIDPMAIIEELPVGIKQRVEILKELYRNAKLIIFDEPTAVLTPLEVEELFVIMNELKKSGRSIIFISHKLKESLEIADRIIVMRQGKVVGEISPKNATVEILAELMVGRKVLFRLARSEKEPGDPVLQVNNLIVKDKNKRNVVNGISFQVRENEIVGVVGVQGNGQTELLDAIMGVIHNISGSIRYYNSNKPNDWIDLAPLSTIKILEKGIAYIPEDRSTQGLIAEFQIKENSWLGYITQPVRAKHYLGEIDKKYLETHSGKLVLKKKNKYLLPNQLMKRFAKKIVNEMEVATPAVSIAIKNLSGGNQQKLILGREFAKMPRLIIASQPTRGVDVGVTERVRNALIEMRKRGTAIFLISSDLDEVLSLSDYILVMYEGKIVGDGPINEFTIEKLSKLMTTGRT
jgi:simple sugar transport system ATP-binding protein